jgi:hypothetical protein
MKLDWKIALGFCSLSVLISPLAQAQFCGLTNASLSGAYGYVASEAGAVVTPTTTTSGTTGTGSTGTGSTTTLTFSDSATGQLLGGIAAGNQFALGGVWTFDGAGNVNATSTPGATAMHIGTYKVNSDCSVSVSLADTFGTNTSVTQLAGVALASGAEIDLTSAATLQTSTSTTTATTGSGLAIKLVRVLYQNGCSVSNLKGLYGFVLNPTSIQAESPTTTTGTTTPTTGTGTTTSTASQPSAVIGYLEFDGAGHIVALQSTSAVASSTSTSSSFASLQYTGTYSVNSDCSGTMTISNSSASSTTTGTATSTTGSAATSGMTLNFVITPPVTQTGGGFAPSPGLDLSFSTASASGSGYALAQ